MARVADSTLSSGGRGLPTCSVPSDTGRYAESYGALRANCRYMTVGRPPHCTAPWLADEASPAGESTVVGSSSYLIDSWVNSTNCLRNSQQD